MAGTCPQSQQWAPVSDRLCVRRASPGLLSWTCALSSVSLFFWLSWGHSHCLHPARLVRRAGSGLAHAGGQADGE